ncbi:diacylglycerol kinase family protein [uncultured Novosphingobium sp.]|uniref:diacylglycerol kinase family protein n=1 Tax=uncultured Novosphingobium sp. TaxID=292277 RepID=UPI0025989E97|nr:diacylglycerol kinase family protein [uncultured Novosphingobium sp.]
MTSQTSPSAPRCWLVCNAASGSNDDAAVAEVEAALTAVGFVLERRIGFPGESAPEAPELAKSGIALLAIFGGDGTTHSAVAAAHGWDGPVLVLPGGTMNMLAKRLHGDVPAAEIIARLAPDRLPTSRPTVISTRHGIALTGILAGPGTVWNEVREAMRAGNVLDFVAATRDAIAWSVNGPKVVCMQGSGSKVDGAREDGYAAITVTPAANGLEAKGYYAETPGDFAGQGIALLNRDFRDGPHDRLGRHEQLRLVCPEGEPMGLLIDGEPFDGGTQEHFLPTTSEVDLVTTIDES